MRIKRATGVVTLSAAALLVLTACGGHGNGSSDSVDNAKAKAQAIATSSANAAAENKVETQVTACVNNTKPTQWLSKSGRQQVVDCLKNLVPPAQQDKFKQCVANTAATDKVWTKAGRATFENEGVATCVTQATGTAAPATAAPSATASK
jgi:hypothetical protein